MEIRPGYKQTEVGVIPEDWGVVRLDGIADVDADNLATATPQDYAFNYISLEDVDVGMLRGYSSQVFSSAPSRARRRLRPSDLLVATVRPNLKSHLLFKEHSGEWICSTGFSVVRCKEAIASSGYVFAHLFARTVSTQIEALLTGSNYPAINGKDIKALLLPFPPTKAEQEAIAEALSDADALVESLEQLIAKKRHIKQGAMQELLTGKKRLPGFSGKWVLRPLIDFVKAEKFAIVDGPFGTQMKVEEYVPEGVPIIEMEHLHDNLIIQRLERCITTKKFEQLKRSAVYPGDIVISKTGSLGYLGIIPDNVGRGIITSRLAKISLSSTCADRSFVFQYLLKLRNDGYWEIVSQGGTMQILGIRMLQNAPIPQISLPEQTAIAEVLSDMDTEIAILEARLAKARQIKQGIMQELLTGRIRLI